VSFERPDQTKEEIRAIKKRFGLQCGEEIKWNGIRLTNQQQREALSSDLLEILSQSKLLITLSEGRDRQVALEYLTIQLDDFLTDVGRDTAEPVVLTCDDGIIRDPVAYRSFLEQARRPRLLPMCFESVDSKSNELIQCADVCAGFSRLLVDLALGRPDRKVLLLESTHEVELDLRHLVLFSLRYSMWGKVQAIRDVGIIEPCREYPFLHTAGYGLRIHSTLAEALISRIYEHSGVVYIGCLH